MTTTGNGWAQVATAIKARRLELGMTQADAAGAAGISTTTWGYLEKQDRPVKERTRALVSLALGWPADAIDLILAGEEPPASDDPTAARTLPAWEAELVRTVQTLTEVVRELATEVRMARQDHEAPDRAGRLESE